MLNQRFSDLKQPELTAACYNLAMVSRDARAQRGQRADAQQPKGRGKNLTILGAMSLQMGFLEGLSFSGGLTGDLFVWLIET